MLRIVFMVLLLGWATSVVGQGQDSPVNDAFSNRTMLEGADDLRVEGTTAGATWEPGEPFTEASTWYSWTSPANGWVDINVATLDRPGPGANLPYSGPRRTLYQGDALETLTRVDFFEGPNAVSAGEVFHIQVAEDLERGPYELSLHFQRAPLHDSRESPLDLGQRRWYAMEFSLDSSTRASGDPVEAPELSLWWQWQAPADGVLILEGYLPDVAIFERSEEGLQWLLSDRGSTRQVVESGKSYLWAIGETHSNGELYGFDLLFEEAVVGNDTFSDARQLPMAVSAQYEADFTSASIDPGDPEVIRKPSVWWRIEVETATWIQIGNTPFEGQPFPELYLFEGDDLATLQPVAWEEGRFVAEAGRVYHLAQVTAGPGVKFFVRTAPLAGHGVFNEAFELESVAEGRQAAVTLEAPLEAGEVIDEEVFVEQSVWYLWQAPESGLWRLGFELLHDFNEFRSDDHIAVYQGDDLESLQLVGMHPAGSEAAISVTAGETYRVALRAGALSDQVIEASWRTDAAHEARFADRFNQGRAWHGEWSVAGGVDLLEPDEPDHLAVLGDRWPSGAVLSGSTWFSWTASQDTVFVGDALRSGPFAVYQGESLSELINVPFGERSVPVFRATAGETYHIALLGKRDGQTLPRLVWNAFPIHEHDAWTDARSMVESPQDIEIMTIHGATREQGEPMHSKNGAEAGSWWWHWKSDSERVGFVHLVRYGDFIPAFAVYHGDAVEALEAVPIDSDSLTFVLEPNVSHWIAVTGDDARQGAFGISFESVARLENDSFTEATVLEGGPSWQLSGSLHGASRDPGDPPGGGNLWWRWEPEEKKSVRVDWEGWSSVRFGVYRGNDLDVLEEIHGTSTATDSPLFFTAEPGLPYYFIIAESALREGGQFIANIESRDPAPQGTFEEPISLGSVSDIQYYADARGQTLEPGVSAAGIFRNTSTPAYVTWFSWESPADVRVSLEPSSGMTVVGVQGDRLDALTVVSIRSRNGGPIAFEAAAGEKFRFALGPNPAEFGRKDLEWRFRLHLETEVLATNGTSETAEDLGGVLRGSVWSSGAGSSRAPEFVSDDQTFWFQWRAPETRSMTFWVDEPGRIEPRIYEGSPANPVSREFPAIAGETYFISVVSSARFHLKWAPLDDAPPVNDSFESASPLATDALRFQFEGELFRGTTEGNEPDIETGRSSVWWRWEVPQTGNWRLSAITDGVEWHLYSGSDRSELTLRQTAWKSLHVAATEGETLWLRANTYAPKVPFEVIADMSYEGTTPVIEVVDGLTGVVDAGADVWQWQAPRSGVLTFTSPNPPFQVRRQGEESFLELVDLSENRSALPVSEETVYEWVMTSEPVQPVGFDLLEPVAHDQFEDRLILTELPLERPVSDLYLTTTQGPVGPTLANQGNLWLEHTASGDGMLTVTTPENTAAALYEGGSLPQLRRLAGPSRKIERVQRAGEVFQIAIRGLAVDRDLLGHYTISEEIESVPEVLVLGETLPQQGSRSRVFHSTVERILDDGDRHTARFLWRWTASRSVRVAFRATENGLQLYRGSDYQNAEFMQSSHSSLVWDAVEGETYLLAVAIWKAPFDLAWRLDAVEEIENDAFSEAAVLSTGPDSQVFKVPQSTFELHEPYTPDGRRGSLWWRWEAPRSGMLQMVGDALSRSGQLEILQGDDIEGLESLAGPIGVLRVPVLENESYWLRWIDPPLSAVGMIVDVVEAPSHDAFAGSTPLVGLTPEAISSSLAYATTEPGEPRHFLTSEARASLWWSWTAPETRVMKVEIEGEGLPQFIQLNTYRGNRLTSLQRQHELYPYTGRGQFLARGGETYHLALATDEELSQDFVLQLKPAESPPNVTQDLAVDLGSVRVHDLEMPEGTAMAAVSPDDIQRGGGRFWWRWTAPESGVVSFVRQVSARAPVQMYEGDTFLTMIPSEGGGEHAYWGFRVQQGRVYHIAIGELSLPMDANAMSFHYAMEWYPEQANDDLAQAIDLGAVESLELRGHTYFATSEIEEPFHGRANGPSTNTRWYQWMAPGDGRWGITSDGIGIQMALYEGTNYEDLARLLSDAGRIEVDVREGVTYRLAIDSGGGLPYQLTHDWSGASPQTPFQSWLGTFGEQAGVIPTGDADGDGLFLAVEYLFGTDPLQATANPMTLNQDGAGVALTFPLNPDFAGEWRLEASEDMKTWTPLQAAVDVDVEIDADVVSARLIATEGSGIRFLRLSVAVESP